MPEKKQKDRDTPREGIKVQKIEIHSIFEPKDTLNDNQSPYVSPQVISSQSSFSLGESDDNNQSKMMNKSQTIQKVLNRLGLQHKTTKQKNDQDLQVLIGDIVQNCVGTIDTKSNLQQYQSIYSNDFKQYSKQYPQKNSLTVSELTEIQKIETIKNTGIIAIYKEIRLFLKRISEISNAIVEHNMFETVILLIIILNSIKMALDDPLSEQAQNSAIENIFIVLYVIQMVLKVMAYGFIFNEKAYLRDLWNILDFVIVVTSLLPIFISIDFSVNSLRAIRVLRPLKTITKIKALKMIVSTLFYSFSLVMDSLYILCFVMLVFSIAGTQLFSGVLKNRCMELSTGSLSDILCINGEQCPQGDSYVCAKGIQSPNFSVMNFDTVLWSMLTVFQTFTMEGWSDIMINLQISYSPFSFIFSLLIVFLCEYVLLNMTMAILKYKYSQVKGNTIESEQQQEQQYQPQFLKKLGVFKNISSLSSEPPLQRFLGKDKIFVGSLQLQDLSQYRKQNYFLDEFRNSDGRKQTTHLRKQTFKKSKKIDLDNLTKQGKIDEYKWDVKALHFQSIDPLNPNGSNQSLKSQKNIENIKDQDQKQHQGQMVSKQVSIASMDYEGSEDQSYQGNQDYDINEKLYEIQMRIGTKKNIDREQYASKRSKFQQKRKTEHKNEYECTTKQNKHYIKEFNNIQELVRETSDKKVYGLNHNIQLPNIDFNEFKTDRFYERFCDLGELGIKRHKKVNQLDFFTIRQKHKHSNIQKKPEKNIIKQITQENSLDIKELQLVNELAKKKMKCRVKKNQDLNIQESYETSRVLILKNNLDNQKKSRQLKQNMETLKFKVSYKYMHQPNNHTQNKVYWRDLNNQYQGIKIPQMIFNRQKKQKNESEQNCRSFSRTANYIKMLQKHKMDEKIQMQEDRIMTIFFKKDKSYHSQSTNKYEQQYKSVKQADIFNRHGSIFLSQPVEVMKNLDKNQFLDSINIKDQQYDIYIKGPLGIINVIRKKTLLFITRLFYDNFMLILVIANTLTLSLNGIVDTTQPQFVDLNLAFTLIFAVDIVLKIFAYGFDFFGDIMNIFDSFVVSISIVQLSLGTGSSNLSALRSIRILRAFRVLRITRLIRSLNYMKIVMSVVSSVITEFVYIFMLLILFIFIYTLLGMQIFGGQLYPQQITGIRQNFDNFFNAFFSVFQVLTMENWNDIELAVIISKAGYISIFYFITWIFIGNWILLNLLQAILLDGFDKDSSPDSPEQQQQQEEQDNYQSQKSLSEEQKTQTVNSFQNSLKKLGQEDDISLLMFYADSPIRVWATTINKSAIFQNFIIGVIALSSIKLVVDTYLPNQGSAAEISDIIDIVFNSIFIFQCLLKIISKGFIIGKNAYLKDSWCQLDFFIVVTAIIDMSLGNIDLSILKLFRTLRPLRIVSRNPDMKVMIASLAQSMLGIFNVIIIILCIFLMFGILGINLLQDKLAFCNQNSNLNHGFYGPYGVSREDCEESGGIWTTQFINFDNILYSLLSLYVFSTRENWPFYVYTFIDAGDQAPTKDANQLLYMVFSFVIIFVCSYFFMDLLVGVLFMNFHQAQQKIRPKKLNDKQINWKNLQKIIIEEDPCFQLYLKPQNPIRAFFHKIVTSKVFQIAIPICILGNIVSMTISSDDQTDQQKNILSNINFVFSIIFICEMILKLAAYLKAYFLSGWNIFDFFVVMASILDIILDFTGTSSQQSSTITILPQIARIFRVLRITRLLRMFKRFKGLQKLIQTFIFSFPALARGLSIVGLFLFISSVLASYLFSNIAYDFSGNIDDNRNFENFHSSLQTLFIITTGQNWYFYMYETILPGYLVCYEGSQCHSMAYLIFWLIYVFFSQKVFMQLFVLIVLDQFESNYIKENNPLGIFSLFEQDFRSNWIEHTSKYHSQKIETKRLLELLLALKQPLGLGKNQLIKNYEEELRQNEKMSEEEIQTSLKELDMKLKKNGAKVLQKLDIIKNRIYLGYHQTFYYFSKLTFLPEISQNSTQQQKQIMQEIHSQSEEKLLNLMPEGNNFEFQENQYEVHEPLNAIQLILFSQMIVKSWHNYSMKFYSQKRQLKKKSQQIGNDSLNNSCDSQIEEAQLEKMPIQKKIYKRKGFIEGIRNEEIEFKVMPNIDQHYQNEKKRGMRGKYNSQDKRTNQKDFKQSFLKKSE